MTRRRTEDRFIHSWDELVIVLFIASQHLFTLPRRICSGINENVDPTIAAVATMLTAFSLALMLAEAAVRRRRA
jgi:putative spermidine/putrescine transport system permease protein